MSMDLTFRNICKLLKSDKDFGEQVVDDVDSMLSLVLLCSSAAMGPATLGLCIPVIAVKNEVVKIGKRILGHITSNPEADYLARYKKMQMAHGLIVFTAFFDALDSCLTDEIRQKLQMLESDRLSLAKKSIGMQESINDDDLEVELKDTHFADSSIHFPHPAEHRSFQLERHDVIWSQMFDGFIITTDQLPDNQKLTTAELDNISSKLKPSIEETFNAQLLTLAAAFEEFGLWLNIQQGKLTTQKLSQLSKFVRHFLDILKTNSKVIDVGFANLQKTVLEMPEHLRLQDSIEIAKGLRLKYDAIVQKPIHNEPTAPPDNSTQQLKFPKVKDAYVPQSFKVLHPMDNTQNLESADTWSKVKKRNDLGAFLLSYLTSPYSVNSPLLVLGQPGSGKSLLTKVLAAQLSSTFTVVRVELRNVNAESSPIDQFQQAIKQITTINVDSWIRLSHNFKNNPAIVILDGFDELLQASGAVFANYLNEIQEFQQNELEQERPLRIIVTSRITLINKAKTPYGSTVLRLLPFDQSQRQRWISIWNRANNKNFKSAGIEPFSLPNKESEGSAKVLELAEQPLLLMMLALYDSNNNQLDKSKGLDRATLYKRLLKQFVEREQAKTKSWRELDNNAQSDLVDFEMNRLGIAALGMFNRRSLHIHSDDLTADLDFFNATKQTKESNRRKLSSGELLLGSFFFIHKSESQNSFDTNNQNVDATFEFLHNTFGEYLTADFILTRLIKEVKTIQDLQSKTSLKETLDEKLRDANGLHFEWFCCLAYTPLFTRPVVLELLRESTANIRAKGINERSTFYSALDRIVWSQLNRILNQQKMPTILASGTTKKGDNSPLESLPLSGHLAVYSLNLILLRTVIAEGVYTFDEDQFTSHEYGARPWDRLTHIWRAWFSLDNLSGVTGIIKTKRRESTIEIHAHQDFITENESNRLRIYQSVAETFNDVIASSMSKVILYSPSRGELDELTQIEFELEAESVPVWFNFRTIQFVTSSKVVTALNLREFLSTSVLLIRTAIHLKFKYELQAILNAVKFGFSKVIRPDNRPHVKDRIDTYIDDFFSHESIVHNLMSDYPDLAVIYFELWHFNYSEGGNLIFSSQWFWEIVGKKAFSNRPEFLVNLSSITLGLGKIILADLPSRTNLVTPSKLIEIVLSTTLSIKSLIAVWSDSYEKFEDLIKKSKQMAVPGQKYDLAKKFHYASDWLSFILDALNNLNNDKRMNQLLLRFLNFRIEVSTSSSFNATFGSVFSNEFADAIFPSERFQDSLKSNPLDVLYLLLIFFSNRLNCGPLENISWDSYFESCIEIEGLEPLLLDAPQHVLALIKLAKKCNQLEILRSILLRDYDSAIWSDWGSRITNSNDLTLVAMLKIARIIDSSRYNFKWLEDILLNDVKFDLSESKVMTLPIKSYDDLKWFVKNSKNNDLKKAFNEIVNSDY